MDIGRFNLIQLHIKRNSRMLFFQKAPNQRELMLKIQECIALVDTHENDINLIRPSIKQRNQDIYTGTSVVEIPLDLLNELSMLLDTYPCLPSDELMTLEHLNLFYNDREQHHGAVLSLVHEYLPEIYPALKSIAEHSSTNKRFV